MDVYRSESWRLRFVPIVCEGDAHLQHHASSLGPWFHLALLGIMRMSPEEPLQAIL